MPWRLSFEIWGENFHPSRVPFEFTKEHDPGVIGTRGRYRDLPIPYGSATYEVPRSVPEPERILHISETFHPLLASLKESGATRWHISIGRYYWGQCNEDYSLEELQAVTRLECGFIYSAYEVSQEEELELEREYFSHGLSESTGQIDDGNDEKRSGDERTQ